MRLLRLPFRDWTAQNLAALALFGVSVAVCVAAAAAVLARSPMPAVTPRPISPLPRLASVRATDDHGMIAAALASDPFATATGQEDVASETGGDGAIAVTAALPAPAFPTVRLQGVAFLPGGARAVIAVGDHPARLLRQGQTVIDQLRVARVAADGVTLASPDTTFVLRLARQRVPSAVPVSPSTVAATPARP